MVESHGPNLLRAASPHALLRPARQRSAFSANGRVRFAVRRIGSVGVALALAGYAIPRASHADDALWDFPGATDWSGFYIGPAAALGRGRASSAQNSIFDGVDARVPPVAPSSSKPGGSGYLLGGELGYRWQADPVVIGVGADFSVGSVGGSAAQAGTFGNAPFASSQKATLDWLSTVRVSLGYSPVDRLLVYATGGLGIAQITNKASVNFAQTQSSGSRSLIQPGWAAGAGAEYRVSDHWSVKLEFLHAAFGTATNVSPTTLSSGSQFQSNFTMQDNTVIAGVRYSFGASVGDGVDQNGEFEPVVATYADQYFGELNYQLGTRYWPSMGSMYYKLGTVRQNPLISQLNYTGIGASSGEVYWRVGHPAGPFVKGFAGIGGADGGSLRDQDFPPFIQPYSATSSSQSNGSLGYLAIDVGYDALQGERWHVGPFVGYGLYREQLNAYGCTQTATNPGICGRNLPVSPNVLGISEDATWNFARLGFAGEVDILPHLALSADLAWVPVGALNGTDTHWLRTDLTGPTAQSGSVSGMQLEMALRYRIKDWLDLGVGGRYWRFNSTGKSVFQGGFGQSSQPTRFSTERFGPFLQVGVAL